MANPGYQDGKKGEDEKSKLFSFRLHPESEDPAEVALFHEFIALKRSGGSLRKFSIDTYRQVKRMPEKSKPMPIVDTRKIMDKLDKVLNYLKGMKMTGGATLAPAPDVEYSDDWLSTLDRYLDAGLEDGSGMQYYEDED